MERIETLDPDPDFERPIDPRRDVARRSSWLWPIVMVVAVVLAAALVWRGMHRIEPAIAPPAPAAAEPAAPPAPATTAPRFPIDAAAPAAEAPTSLPALADSDSALQSAMAGLFAAVPLDRVFHLQAIATRFVATIDNLPRPTVALSRMSVKPVDGALETAESGGTTLLRADNAARYSTDLRVMEQADTRQLVATYVRFYPLFQKAYEDLGYPNGYFNDRLVDVIDLLLATPDVPAPIALAQPKVLYEFADPALEQRSAGQKMLIRMGPVNESRVKAKLRDIRHALTGQLLPR